MLRNEKKPTTSVTVVTNGLEATAGSTFEPVQGQWNENSAQRSRNQIADHRKPDHETEAWHLEPDISRHSRDDSKGDAVEQTDQQFARDHPPGIGIAQGACRKRAYRNCHGLRGRIAALARHNWRQYRQRHHLFQLTLKQTQHRGGQEGRREINQQPVEAAARNGPYRVRQFFVVRDPAQGVNVFFRLLRNHIGNVVESNDADQAIVSIDYGAVTQL